MAMLALSLGTFLIVLDYSIANVSIPYIAGDLAVSVDEGTYVITSFAIGNAIVLPITGWLTNRLGMVRLFLLSLALFTLFSWICGSSLNLEMLVISRFIQGAVAGPLIPLSQSLLVKIYPAEKRNRAVSLWSTVIIVAPIVGPVLGGWLSYDYSWPWIFFINIPIGIFCIIVLKILFKDFETPINIQKTDWIGLLLLALAVMSLQIVLDRGQEFDWWNSLIIRTLAITSIVSFSFLFAWEFICPQPLLELKLLKIPSFSLSIIYIAISYAIYFGTVVLIPLWLQTNMQYTSIWAGLAVAPMGIIPVLCTTFIGKWIEKVGKILPLFISFVSFAVACFYTAYFDTDIDFFHIAFSRFLLGIALLFFITPLISFSIQDLPNDKLASGTGMFHFVRAMMGAVGTSLFTTLWTRRSYFHHSNIVTYVNEQRLAIDEFYSKIHQLQIKGDKAVTLVNNLCNDQAALLALNDCNYVMGWIFLILILILPLGIKRKKKSVV